MSDATALPSDRAVAQWVTVDGLWHFTFRAMASPIRVQFPADGADPASWLALLRELFTDVERECTRFCPTSDLMRANAAGTDWHVVGRYCFAALEAAYDAHLMTDGMFEPRVLATLAALGYGASWLSGEPSPPEIPELPDTPSAQWQPEFDPGRQAVRVGPDMLDLGGIGKGLALRWSADLLHAAGCGTFLVEAGGDVVAAGGGPDGTGWRIGVEDPSGADRPVAVLRGIDHACATSSTRLRRWRAGGEEVHHLIDPRTGRSGGSGLRSVTVVGDDPAEAEVWSKTLFLHGDRIGAAAERRGLPALWVQRDHTVNWTEEMTEYLLWCR